MSPAISTVRERGNAGITAAQGFAASGIRAGIKASNELDMGVVTSDRDCAAAGCFTRNKVRASCVDWCSGALPSSSIRAIVCNSGNANACTGLRGRRDTETVAGEVGRHLGTGPRSILVASTGIIGHPLPMKRVKAAVPELVHSVSPQSGALFARAIMTTDTKTKEHAVRIRSGNGGYTIGGCAKGSGMICPNMATMLAFVTTDAGVGATHLSSMLSRVVDGTFNNLTVDGDTSTNDMVLVLANSASGVSVTSPAQRKVFEEALFSVCNNLCAKIAEDGEGATKRIEIRVRGGRTEGDAKAVARCVANSNLVKTALFGNDPNWGRILCAIGYSGASFSSTKLRVSLCGVPVCKGTTPAVFAEGRMRRALARKVVEMDIDLGQGKQTAIAHTCDLSYEYVRINAEYHT